MSKFIEYKGWLIESSPTPRGDAGYGAMVSLIHKATEPVESVGPIIWEPTYATYEEAYQVGIDAAKRRIDTGDLPYREHPEKLKAKTAKGKKVAK